MNNEQAKKLLEEAKEFFGQRMPINYLDDNNRIFKTIPCTFNGEYSMTSISENGGNPVVDVYAKLIDDAGGVHTVHMSSLVREFKRIKVKVQ